LFFKKIVPIAVTGAEKLLIKVNCAVLNLNVPFSDWFIFSVIVV
jgi:hypothetical protein